MFFKITWDTSEAFWLVLHRRHYSNKILQPCWLLTEKWNKSWQGLVAFKTLTPSCLLQMSNKCITYTERGDFANLNMCKRHRIKHALTCTFVTCALCLHFLFCPNRLARIVTWNKQLQNKIRSHIKPYMV